MTARTSLDALDHELIQLLSKDARVSNRKIAASLGVTEGTVRGRIRRLQQDGMIAFTAITGLGMARKSQLAFIGIQASLDSVELIASQIAKMDEVNAVLLALGQYNILAICLFDELGELVALASDRIQAIPGVLRIETSVAVRTAKYNARVAKLTRTTHISD